ncbi:MAG: hypothetical protein IPJ40_00015 [Saprospirales bacterium]|nr:hypothetical protein [Saprospirales bacterium]
MQNVMRITIETESALELEQILQLLKKMHIKSIQVSSELEGKHPIVTKGDKNIDPTPLWGIWKDQVRDLGEIRKANWIPLFEQS